MRVSCAGRASAQLGGGEGSPARGDEVVGRDGVGERAKRAAPRLESVHGGGRLGVRGQPPGWLHWVAALRRASGASSTKRADAITAAAASTASSQSARLTARASASKASSQRLASNRCWPSSSALSQSKKAAASRSITASSGIAASPCAPGRARQTARQALTSGAGSPPAASPRCSVSRAWSRDCKVSARWRLLTAVGGVTGDRRAAAVHGTQQKLRVRTPMHRPSEVKRERDELAQGNLLTWALSWRKIAFPPRSAMESMVASGSRPAPETPLNSVRSLSHTVQ